LRPLLVASRPVFGFGISRLYHGLLVHVAGFRANRPQEGLAEDVL
jgi:hypothetical protein